MVEVRRGKDAALDESVVVPCDGVDRTEVLSDHFRMSDHEGHVLAHPGV